MSDFETALQGFLAESLDIQKLERELETKQSMFSEKLFGFLRQNGLPEKFTLPELMQLAIRKTQG